MIFDDLFNSFEDIFNYFTILLYRELMCAIISFEESKDSIKEIIIIQFWIYGIKDIFNYIFALF
jgi:hypothetical protein